MFLQLTDADNGEAILVNMDHVKRVRGSSPGGAFLDYNPTGSAASLEVKESLRDISNELKS